MQEEGDMKPDLAAAKQETDQHAERLHHMGKPAAWI
jgi:hypothetical protein